MNFDPDELDEELALDSLSQKRASSPKKKRKELYERSIRKRKDRAREKRRDEISIGRSRGRRKRFLSAFGARSSVARGGGISHSKPATKSRTRQQFPRSER